MNVSKTQSATSVLCLSFVIGSCAPAVDPSVAPPDRVTAVVLPYLTHMPFYIAQEEGYFEEQGLDVEFFGLGRNQDIMTALAHGDVDVAAGMLTVNELSLAAAGARLRIVGALGVAAPEVCSLSGFVARRELVESGALLDPERLRALRVDVDPMLPFGFLLDEVLRPTGLTIDDLHLVNVPPPSAVESLQRGLIDITADAEPFLSFHQATGDSVLWRGVETIVPGFVQSVLMYGPGFLDERPDVGNRFMAAMLKAVRQFRLGKTPRNLEIVEAASGLEREQVATVCWPVPPDDVRLDPAVFGGYQRWLVARGLLDRVLPDAELFDFRFADRANLELAR